MDSFLRNFTDALFGKRTIVQDAHDKYANEEISFLLQMLEEYRGMIIFDCKECDSPDPNLAKAFQTLIHFPLAPIKVSKK
jgi:hypothetical protein